LAGGDGTVQQYLTKLVRRYESEDQALPRFLVLPTGTMNNLAGVLGITRMPPQRFAERMNQKLERSDALSVTRIRTLKVNDEIGFVFGAGLPVGIIRHYESLGAGGAANALRTVAEAFAGRFSERLTLGRFGFSSPPVTAELEVQPTEGPPKVIRRRDYTAIMAGTIENIGLGCSGLPEARLSGGFVLRTSTLTVQAMMFLIGPLWAGMPLLDTDDTDSRRVRITYATPTIRLLDGEIKPPAREDVLSLGPEVNFIVG
jgi:hypothetical protein